MFFSGQDPPEESAGARSQSVSLGGAGRLGPFPGTRSQSASFGAGDTPVWGAQVAGLSPPDGGPHSGRSHITLNEGAGSHLL